MLFLEEGITIRQIKVRKEDKKAMKKNIFSIFVLILCISLVGCGRKQQPVAQMQEPISIEELSNIDSQNQATSEITAKTESALITPVISASASGSSQGELASLPPSGPYKPTSSEIQTALKNAGYYTGLIDGKVGPLTKKAIEDFQKANSLSVDGKVGPKTWALLSTHLNPQPVSSKSAKKR